MSNIKKPFEEILKYMKIFMSPQYQSNNSLKLSHSIQQNYYVKYVQRYLLRIFTNVMSENSFKDVKKYSGNFQVVEPNVTNDTLRFVPLHISKPPYYFTTNEEQPDEILIKTKEQIESIKLSCSLAKKMLDEAENFIEVGKTTDELDAYIHNLIIKHDAYPSPLNYQNFPKSICTSVNNVVCHGIPDNRKLVDGDIITVDISVYLNGFHGDCAATFLVGNVDEEGKRLVRTTKEIVDSVIHCCGPGVSFNVIGKEIELKASKNQLTVIPCVCGHGIGEYFHELPNISHYDSGFSVEMLPGMIFTIEPALCNGLGSTVICDDGWTVLTEDDSLAAQFEHTVLITETGVDVLTKNKVLT